MATFYVENFGCRATQADGAALERQFRERGLTRADSSQAEVVVLNTCTVTASADQDARSAIRRVRRQNPHAKIIVTGCYAQRAPQELQAIPGVDVVVGNSHKHAIVDLILPAANGSFVPLAHLGASLEPKVMVGDIFAHTELLAAPVFEASDPHEKTRPNLKIQDGCNNRCSFCVIPYVRGRSRSLRLEHVIREVDSLVASGYREIVLSGINLGRWGRELSPRMSFASLLREILQSTSIDKIRISSVEPMDWTNELIELVAFSPRICKHAHVPLQSGSDKVLRRMHRKYRPWHYADRIERIRGAAPDAAIGADVMVGFPGESNDDFEQTRTFIEALPFTYLHVFTYSSRPGTPSAEMPNQVPVQVARERNRILRDLAEEKKRAFMQSFVGCEVEAITLTRFDGEYTEALTHNYLKLMIRGQHEANQLLRVPAQSIAADMLVGSLP